MPTSGPNSPGAAFPATHWSVILTACQGGSADAAAALAELCHAYWYPLYAYARRSGRPAAEAQDLTQGFFEHLLRRRLLDAADAARGRFRTFLLTCFKNFIASEHARAAAQKRGGARPWLSLDAVDAETRFGLEMADRRDPEWLFERNWALALLNEGLDRLACQCRETGRSRVFEALSPSLRGDPDGPTQARIARDLDTTEGTVRVMAYRLRRRYRELLRELVAQTVATPLEVEDELRHLLEVLQR